MHCEEWQLSVVTVRVRVCADHKTFDWKWCINLRIFTYWCPLLLVVVVWVVSGS